MSAVPYMKFYIGDYLGDTQHLTTLQHGAYMLLIMAYWQRRGPLPMDDDKLSRIARCAIAEWMQCKSDVLAFFDERDGMLYHGRIDKELEGVAEISEQRKRAAHKKWDNIPKSDANALQEDSKGNANDMLSHIHSHIPYSDSNTEPKKEKEADKPPRQTFVKPTIDEIREYCQERKNAVDPGRFIDFYESKGWLIGKNKMKDWRAAVRTWEQHDFGDKRRSGPLDDRPEAWDEVTNAKHREAIENRANPTDLELAEIEKSLENLPPQLRKP